VNEAIIFRHFATKDDLYAAILDYKANEVCSADWLAEMQEHAARRDDEALFRHVAEKKLTHHALDEDDQFLRLMFYSALEGHTLAHIFLERHARPLHEFLCDYVRLRQREGVFRQVHPRVVVNAFIGALNHHVLINAFFKDWRVEITDEEAITIHVQMLLHGLHVESDGATAAKPAINTRGKRREKSTGINDKKVKR
jgi:AcrR family transcriptional regulator